MIVKKSDDAVSPVIGVMLMLVVTVVIGAAVTIFATGVVGETEAAPVAVLDVKIYTNYPALYYAGKPNLFGPDLHITHVSGDNVDTKDIELRFSWTHKDGSGKDCSHYSAYSAEGMTEYISSNPGGDWISPANFGEAAGIDSNGGGNRYQALYVKMSGGRGTWGLDHYFGEVTLTPGMKLTASADMLSSTLSGTTINTGSQFMDAIFNNYKMTASHGTPCTGGIMNHLPAGTAVDVMIVHLPSDKAIYDKTVIVE